jgi:hypothetical protein
MPDWPPNYLANKWFSTKLAITQMIGPIVTSIRM